MNRASSRQPSRRDEARALFRNAILDSAEAVFAQKGFHGARIQDIAARARTAVGTVYNHFEDKDDVLHALLEERTEEMLEQLRVRPGDPTSFRERLEARVGRLLAHVSEHRAFFAIANEHGLFAANSATPGAQGHGRSLKRVERFRALFRALVQEGVASGDLERIDGDALARFLGGTIRAFVLSSLAKGDADASEQARMVVELFLYGASRRGTKRTR